ncbi:hypothetical protein Ciccas_007644 [Cichlidogyrus casuarinus]|uniref:Uncharacterized protein n=1 Tax=Cichlidogyrus casuarinus TaxID=1844966 RepID=A0ABD2Q330_9PLAT
MKREEELETATNQRKEPLAKKMCDLFAWLQPRDCSQWLARMTLIALWSSLATAICLLIVGSVKNNYPCFVVGSLLGISSLGALLHRCLHHRSLPAVQTNTAITAAYWYPIKTDINPVHSQDEENPDNDPYDYLRKPTEATIAMPIQSPSKGLHCTQLTLSQMGEHVGIPASTRLLSLSRLPEAPPYSIRNALERQPAHQRLRFATHKREKSKASTPLWDIACLFGKTSHQMHHLAHPHHGPQHQMELLESTADTTHDIKFKHLDLFDLVSSTAQQTHSSSYHRGYNWHEGRYHRHRHLHDLSAQEKLF